MSQDAISGVEGAVGASGSTGQRAQSGIAVYEYNFGRDGGAISTIMLKGPVLPNNAVIKDAYVQVDTVPVGTGASISVGFEDATDINSTDAISGAPWSAQGRVDLDGVEIGTESGYVKLTRARALRMAITGAPLSAGRFSVIVDYDVTDN